MFFFVIRNIMKSLLPLTDIKLRISWPYMSTTEESPSLKNEWICLRICVKKILGGRAYKYFLGHFLGEVGRSKLSHFELRGTMKKMRSQLWSTDFFFTCSSASAACHYRAGGLRAQFDIKGTMKIKNKQQKMLRASTGITSLSLQGGRCEGTSIEFVGQLLEHPIAKQLMVQENLVELAKKVMPEQV